MYIIFSDTKKIDQEGKFSHAIEILFCFRTCSLNSYGFRNREAINRCFISRVLYTRKAVSIGPTKVNTQN